MNYISTEIDRQNKLIYKDLPTKYKHVVDNIILESSEKFSFYSLLKEYINDTSKFKIEVDKMLKEREYFLQEICKTIKENSD